MSSSGTKVLAIAAAGAALAGLLYYRRKQSGLKTTAPAKPSLPVQYVAPGSPVVVVDYQDLVDGKDITASIEAAFGFDGLGLITIRNVPSFVDYRQRLLTLGQKFATLPESVKEKYVHQASDFQFGWSHGKENLQGSPDYSKGSYYNNPVYDKPFDDEEIVKTWPTFAHPNIWPTDDLPEFEPAFKNLGGLVVNVGTLLAKHLDAFVQRRAPGYQSDRLHKVISQGRCHKARLLHYFPTEPVEKKAQGSEEDFGSWCGWHNDHGSLTGLCSAMYLNAQGEPVTPDVSSGLYIRTRRGELVKASFPADHLAFQMGETQQVHSGGLLRATPHCVRAGNSEQMRGVSRETFAVFMEPLWSDSMAIPAGTSVEDTQLGSSHQFLPKGVPPLERRWDPSMDFGQFTKKTLEAYTVY